jgi:hypothetical protein
MGFLQLCAAALRHAQEETLYTLTQPSLAVKLRLRDFERHNFPCNLASEFLKEMFGEH